MTRSFQSPFVSVGPSRLLIPDDSQRSVVGSLAMVGVLALLVFGMMLLFNHQLSDVGFP